MVSMSFLTNSEFQILDSFGGDFQFVCGNEQILYPLRTQVPGEVTAEYPGFWGFPSPV